MRRGENEKSHIILVLMVTMVFSLFGAIVVLTPNGSETITRGTQYEITWLDNISENVKIELYQYDGYHSDISASTESDGSYLWNIPSDLNGENYQIFISSTILPEIVDQSDYYFSIPYGSLALTSPNGGESLTRGSQFEITWTDDVSDDVRIQLYDGYFGTYTDIISSTESDGSYLWDIPNELYGSYYQIIISSTLTPAFEDWSDGTFSIQGGSITVITPNGGESLTRGTQYEITWTDDFPENVYIQLFLSGGYYTDIAVSTESDGSYIWDIPIELNGAEFQIVVISTIGDGQLSDLSDGYFSIPSGSITVTYPNGGETLARGTQCEIKWTDDISENVYIQLFLSGGYYTDIAGSTPSDGSYLWDIPADLTGSDYQIKVFSEIMGDAVSDFSDGYFSIPSGSITVTYPDGGETLTNGRQCEIKWTDDITENVIIQLFQYGSYLNDLAYVSSSGSYLWDIPTDLSGTDYQIKVFSEIMGDAVSDLSDGYFSILGSPENISFIFSTGAVTIYWDEEPYANSYKIYASDNPYVTFELVATVSTNSWITSVTGKKFYYVTASTETLKTADNK
jgi:hypothetical protein